jgi:hypothetical protein
VTPDELGVPVATCYSLQQRIDSGAFVAADDTFYFLRADPAAVLLDSSATSNPAGVTGHVCFGADEMDAAPARILPRGLPALLRRLQAEGTPASPIHIRW